MRARCCRTCRELDALGYRYFFLYTLTGYPRVFELHTPVETKAVETMRRLAAAIGPDRLIWRYDPLLFSHLTPPAYHLEQFAAWPRRCMGRRGAW